MEWNSAVPIRAVNELYRDVELSKGVVWIGLVLFRNVGEMSRNVVRRQRKELFVLQEKSNAMFCS